MLTCTIENTENVFLSGGVKGFDWGPYLAQTGSDGAAVSCFKHVSACTLNMIHTRGMLYMWIFLQIGTVLMVVNFRSSNMFLVITKKHLIFAWW